VVTDLPATEVLSRFNAGIAEYSSRLRQLEGGATLGAIVPDAKNNQRAPEYWAGFPWPQIAARYDVVLPMASWALRSQRLPSVGGRPANCGVLSSLCERNPPHFARTMRNDAGLDLVRLRHRAHRRRELTRAALLGEAFPLPLSEALQGELGFVELDVLAGQGELRALQALLQLGDLARLARRLQSS